MILLLLSLSAGAADRCATPEALDALRGEGPATHPRMLVPPARLDGRPTRGATGKQVYGSNYAWHLETDNFTVNWWDGGVARADAEAAGEALETAWRAFTEEQGWPRPVSSDRYLLWVLLDTSLGSATGYTTEYFTEDYPDGYPVIYLNPAWAYDASFWSALSAHEFMHAIQFAMRGWSGTEGDTENWYWEASANHASELADPDWDGHQYTSAWYAEQPWLRYDSYEGYHQYGMFVLNAWLDERAAGTMLAVWEEGEGREGTSWDRIIEDGAGLQVSAIWGGFTGAYGNELMAESALYTRVSFQGAVAEGAGGSLAYLGTDYWRVNGSWWVEATGDVVLAGAEGPGQRVWVDRGDRLAVTALSDDAGYALHLDADTGQPDDTGGADEEGGGRPVSWAEPAACGCGGPAGGPWLLASLPVLVLRRRPRRRTRGAQRAARHHPA